jgi:hypothetical protein
MLEAEEQEAGKQKSLEAGKRGSGEAERAKSKKTKRIITPIVLSLMSKKPIGATKNILQ